MSLFTGRPRYAGTWWKDHSLSLVLAAIMLVQLIITAVSGYFVFQWIEWQPGMPVGYGVAFTVWMIFGLSMSIIADTYGALLLVLASKWFFEKGSAESTNEENQGS